MTSRPVHFEIHVDDMRRAQDFYAAVFGWGYEDYSDYAGQPYFGIVTGPEDEPGINGALMVRKAPLAENNPIGAAVLTMGVENYDAAEESILANGGRSPSRSMRCREWRGRATSPTPTATSSAFTSLTRRPPSAVVMPISVRRPAGRLGP
ncbi:VOC family protein [Tessaracoccus aquimaris]|uniref:VOC family protein n=1 Tax=Tessaracoccus aquimaris TaxID=1332264 RepID=UPI001D041B5C|nr:VOC family protein [Tessaracoccus aquimaris]